MVGNFGNANKFSEHGFKIARRFFGEDHFLCQKFKKRINILTTNLQQHGSVFRESSKHRQAYQQHFDSKLSARDVGEVTLRKSIP